MTPAIESKESTVPWGLGAGLVALLVAYGIWLLGQLVLLVVLATVAGVRSPRAHLLALEVTSYQFLVGGIVLATVVVILTRYHCSPRVLGYRFPGLDRVLGSAVTGIIVTFLGVVALYGLFSTVFPAYHLHGNTQNLFPPSAKHLPAWKIGLLFLWVAVEAPLAEETLFRGILFQGILHFFRRWWPEGWAVLGGALVSGAIFGLAHQEIHTLPILILAGVVLAYVYYYGRSIFASALLHAAINAVSLIALFHS